MNDWQPVPRIAKLIGITERGVRWNIEHHKYTLIQQADGNGVGRAGKIWLININDPAISESARQKHYASINTNQLTQDKGDSDTGSTAVCAFAPVTPFLVGRAVPPLPVPVVAPMVPNKFKTIALARLDLVAAWQEHRQHYKAPKARLKTDQDFEQAYNMGLLMPRIYEILGAVDISTVKRWHRTLSGSSDWTLLVPQWHCEKKEPALTQEEKIMFRDCLLNPNKLSIGEAIRITKVVLAKRGILSPSVPITFRRWAEWFKGKHFDTWTFLREGEKALKDKVIFSIKRDPSRLEVGDVLVADGHRLNFQVINPYTGKPCRATLIGYLDWKSWNLAGFEIMVEESTQAVASALRNAVIRLGKAPKIAYQDNGKAFRAKFFTAGVDFEEAGFYGLFGKLGISPVFSMKYNAKAKPVERLWKEFTGKFERLLPSFVGSSISDKPAWMNMGETFHRIHHNGYVPTIAETIEMVDTWIREYLEVQPCPHAKGKTIGEVFREGQGSGVNIDELDELMMATEIKTIRANGIRFLGADYYDESLCGLREHVFIRYSLSDLSFVKVYDREGRYLGEAQRTEGVHPMARLLGNAKDMAEVKYRQNKQRSLCKAEVKAAKELMPQKKGLQPWSDIVPLTPRTIEKMEEAEASFTPLPAETRIPDYMLKSNRVADPAPVVLPPENGPKEQSAPVLAAIKQELTSGFTEDQQTTEPSPAAETPLKRPNFRWDELTPRYEWHLKHGCPTKEDEEWVTWYKTTQAYEDNYLFFERQAEEYSRKEATRNAGLGYR